MSTLLMFTGIVEETGKVAEFARGAEAWRLRMRAARAREGVAVGDSIAVNGCCLTVVGAEGGRLHFDVLEETRRLTNFSALRPGRRGQPRAQPAVRRQGGRPFCHRPHRRARDGSKYSSRAARTHYLRVRAPAGAARYLVHKGSIAIDGISLTVAEVDGDAFAVWLIPHTLEVTNLRERRRRRPGQPGIRPAGQVRGEAARPAARD